MIIDHQLDLKPALHVSATEATEHLVSVALPKGLYTLAPGISDDRHGFEAIGGMGRALEGAVLLARCHLALIKCVGTLPKSRPSVVPWLRFVCHVSFVQAVLASLVLGAFGIGAGLRR